MRGDEEWDRKKTVGTFCNTPSEVHMFFMGFYCSWYSLPARLPVDVTASLQEEYQNERQYFYGGEWVARIVQICLLCTIIWLF